jgi:DNA-binding NtrC family response regulator
MTVVGKRFGGLETAGKLNAYFEDMGRSSSRQKDGILLVDDEEGFLSMLDAVFASQGYMVHTASSPNEAIKLYEERWQEIDVVLLDFLLPEMSGDLVFENLQRINPDVRVVLLTGCEESVAENLIEKGLRGFIQKPFDVRELCQKVRDAIDAPLVSSPSSLSPV